MILQVGAEGGDLTLLGRRGSDGVWEFTRATVDQSEQLFGESGSELAPGPVRDGRGWTPDWEAALAMLDRYRWATLHPIEVHPEFRDRVRMAVEARLTKEAPGPWIEQAREKWADMLGRAVVGGPLSIARPQ